MSVSSCGSMYGSELHPERHQSSSTASECLVGVCAGEAVTDEVAPPASSPLHSVQQPSEAVQQAQSAEPDAVPEQRQQSDVASREPDFKYVEYLQERKRQVRLQSLLLMPFCNQDCTVSALPASFMLYKHMCSLAPTAQCVSWMLSLGYALHIYGNARLTKCTSVIWRSSETLHELPPCRFIVS